MQATRASQPYRKGMGTRAPGGALSAMLRGGPAYLPNPTQHTGTLSQQVTTSHQARRARRKQLTGATSPLTKKTL